MIAWKAAYLKAHYPLYQWTAALNNNQGMYPRRVIVMKTIYQRSPVCYWSACPAWPGSADIFTIDDGLLRAGLGAIAGLDEAFRQRLLDDRARRGPYASLAALRQRLTPGPETLGLLIRVGAARWPSPSRPALFLEAELPDLAGAAGKAMPVLFDDDADLAWKPCDYAAWRRLRDEWDLLSFVVGPPLLALFPGKFPAERCRAEELPDQVGRRVVVAGVVAAARTTQTEAGRPMQFITLEVETGLIDVTLFPGNAAPLPYLTPGVGPTRQQESQRTVCRILDVTEIEQRPGLLPTKSLDPANCGLERTPSHGVPAAPQIE